MSVAPLRFKLTVSLPLVVDGGLSKWKIQMEHFGKGDSEYAVVAESLVTSELIKITSGRTREIENRTTGLHFLAQPNTLLYLIARKLIRERASGSSARKCALSEASHTPARRPPLEFRFTCSLPLTVNGGVTEWEILRVSYGRESDVLARCKTTGEVIHLVSARSRVIDGVTEDVAFLAWPGTTLHLIARKLIREGKADSVNSEK